MTWGRTKYVLPLFLAALISGCATVPIDSARRNFSSGNLDEADRELGMLPADADKVMHLMERGMIRHLRRDYPNSTTDWLQAVRIEKELETHSASKAGASMLVNDSVLDFRGYPYERNYLHVYLAKNYLAQGLWQDAGVEARALALSLEPKKLDGFPDDPFSHYISGFCLELNGDDSNASRQYRHVAKLLPHIGLDDRTGRFVDLTNSLAANPLPAPAFTGTELVCFIDFDGVSGIIPEYAEVYVDGRYQGRSRTLGSTLALEIASSQRMAGRRAAKTLGRLALKGAISMVASAKDSDLGNLAWLMLLATEDEDLRRWSTLPTKLAVARVPCPENPKEVRVEFKGYSDITLKRVVLGGPFPCKGRTYVAICRDYPP